MMLIILSDSYKLFSRYVVICYHFLSIRGIVCNKSGFFLWSDFISWQTK